jgi:hypothetical protein
VGVSNGPYSCHVVDQELGNQIGSRCRQRRDW